MHCYILIINHDKPNHIKQYSSNESFIFEKKKVLLYSIFFKLEKFLNFLSLVSWSWRLKETTTEVFHNKEKPKTKGSKILHR